MKKIILLTFLCLSSSCLELSSTKSEGLKIDPDGIINYADKDSFFNYPYTTKSDFYIQAEILKPANSLNLFEEVTVFISLASSDGLLKKTYYEITLNDQNNFPICPFKSGNLSDGKTTIQYTCYSGLSSSFGTLTVNYGLSANSLNYQFQKSY